VFVQSSAIDYSTIASCSSPDEGRCTLRLQSVLPGKPNSSRLDGVVSKKRPSSVVGLGNPGNSLVSVQGSFKSVRQRIHSQAILHVMHVRTFAI